jgi:hypothetical protein
MQFDIGLLNHVPPLMNTVRRITCIFAHVHYIFLKENKLDVLTMVAKCCVYQCTCILFYCLQCNIDLVLKLYFLDAARCVWLHVAIVTKGKPAE